MRFLPGTRMKSHWVTVVFLIIIASTIFLWNGFFLSERQHCPSFNLQPILQQTDSDNFTRNDPEILKLLQQVYLSLQNSYVHHLSPSPSVFNLLDDIIKHLQKHNGLEMSSQTSDSEPQILDVCPEALYKTKDKPFFQKGFFMVKCNNARPIHDVLSVILNFDNDEECNQNINDILEGLNETYPTISIYISEIFINCSDFSLYKNVRFIPPKENGTSGKIWNHLISATTTPYVLIARNLNYFDRYSQIERQIRMISSNHDIQIAGGSQRNASGHWKVGCYQIRLENYILEYTNGYYISLNECMVCDHILGSFIANKSVLTQLPFDEKLPSSVLFEDFFLKVKNANISVVNCPDSMYYSTDPDEQKRMERREIWFPLIQKWELNRIFIDKNIQHSFSCSESKLSCKKKVEQTNAFLLPLCCLEQFGEAVQFFHEFCVSHNVSYEIQSGLVLGSIKMNSNLPWDNDGDLLFYNNNFSVFEKHKNLFVERNYKMDSLTQPRKEKNSFFMLKTPDMRIEMYGSKVLSKDLFLPNKFKDIPTRMKIHHTWVYTQVSPGFYARNCYGRNILKHSNKWIHLGYRSEFETYKPGKFLGCPKPLHHACQNHFHADGSLQFYIP